jgi:AAHS family 4-hydroxybenzoate transporter-like MFS transporter
LFAQGRAPVTVLLWSVFATTFAVLIVTTLWTPALLKTFGMAPASGAIVVGAFNIGCTVGMAAAGRLLERLGLVRSLAPALFLGGLALAAMGYAGHTLLSAALLAVVIGALIGLGASGVIALSTLIYPTEIRSTGVGWAMAAGRAGQAIAPVLTGWLLARGVGVPMVFAIVALAPILAAVLVLLLAAQSRDEAKRTPERGIGRAPA